MIREIRIKNLALIDDIQLQLQGGFSVFTGETGAGKSILIGAIGLLLGDRASSEMIRSGTEEAEVSGIFELPHLSSELAALLEKLAIEPDENAIIIRRTISKNDRNRIHVNQVPLPLASLKEIGDRIIDLHGQHEHQSLLNEENHRILIDTIPSVKEPRFRYDVSYGAYAAAREKLDSFEKNARSLSERKDILEFQHKELSALALRPGEEAELESELSLLSSAAERIENASEILNLLAGPSESIGRRISSVKKRLESLSKCDPSAAPWLNDIDMTMSVFAELETFCGSYLERFGAGADPARIEFLNGRLARIQRLKKKYSCTHDELMEKQRELEAALAAIGNSDADREELIRNVAAALDSCRSAGKALRTARMRAAGEFDARITAQMEKLGFSGGAWGTEFEEHDDPSPQGFEKIRFLVRTNPGEKSLPLVKSASGGEISRCMLAIKTVFAEHDHIPVLIFDEIDTGIGGLLAHEVAKALFSLSQSHQVLCITHLHQIASLATSHFHVYKESSGDRTVTRVRQLDEKEKVGEIARMLGGDSEVTLRHAQDLLRKR